MHSRFALFEGILDKKFIWSEGSLNTEITLLISTTADSDSKYSYKIKIVINFLDCWTRSRHWSLAKCGTRCQVSWLSSTWVAVGFPTWWHYTDCRPMGALMAGLWFEQASTVRCFFFFFFYWGDFAWAIQWK